MKGAYSDSGIVVRSVDTGEADKYVSILTKDHGMCSYVARGARRLSSKKAPHLDLLNKIKFAVGRGESPRFINQAEAECFYPGIKKDYAKISLTLTILEILTNTLPLDVEDKEMYLSLQAFLDALETTKTQKESDNLSRKFGLFLLRHLGYPEPRGKSSLSSYFETIMNRKIVSREIH